MLINSSLLLILPNPGDDWFEIKKVTSKKKVNSKVTFLVHWMDGSKSREPEENISDFAKSQYYVNLKQKQKRRR